MESITSFRRRDWVILILASIALCAEILVLLYQLRVVTLPLPWKIHTGTEKEIGLITLKERSVKNRALNSLTWYPLVGGDKVRLHDTVMTGTRSKARVQLQGEGEVLLNANTLIRFSEEKSWGDNPVLNLVVNQGVVRVKSKARPVSMKLKKRKLALAPQSEIVVEKKLLNKKSHIEVKKGSVKVLAVKSVPTKRKLQSEAKKVEKPQAVIIKAGESVQIETEEDKPQVQKEFKLTGVIPIPQARLFASDKKHQVHFNWKAKMGDKLEWDMRKDFSKPQRVPASAEGAKTLLPPGKYFWRVRRGEALSSVHEFMVVPPASYEALLPNSKRALKRKKPITLKWKPIEEAESYILEVGQEKDFSEILFQETVPEAEKTIKPLRAGKYYWRIQARSDKWGPWPPSEVYSFFVKKPLRAPKPKGAKMLKKKKLKKKGNTSQRKSFKNIIVSTLEFISELLIPSAHAESLGKKPKKKLLWEFEWEPISGAAGYLIEISTTRKFRKVLKRKKVEGFFTTVELPFKKKYFWRVAGIDEDGDRGRFSPIQVATTPKIKRKPSQIKAVSKPVVKKEKIYPPRAEGLGWISPSWIRLGASGSYIQQTIQGANYKVTNSGLPMNRYHLYLHRSLRVSDLELGIWYEQLLFESNNPAFATFQPSLRDAQFGLHLLWKGMFYAWGVPLSMGLGGQKFVDMKRGGNEALGLQSLGYAYLLIGASWNHDLGSKLFWHTDIFIEGGPVGSLQGAGLILRSRVGLWKLFEPFTTELQFILHPSYRYVSEESRSYTNIEVSVAILIGGLFDVSPSWSPSS